MYKLKIKKDQLFGKISDMFILNISLKIKIFCISFHFKLLNPENSKPYTSGKLCQFYGQDSHVLKLNI